MIKVILAISSIILVSIFVTSFSTKKTNFEFTPEQLLTSQAWQLEQLRFLQHNKDYYYKRNVTGDVAGLETESIKFNPDYTGIYIAGEIEYSLTWEFVDVEKTELQYVLNESTPLVITWENLKLSETLLEYTEYYRRGGMNSLASGKRVPVEKIEIVTYREN